MDATCTGKKIIINTPGFEDLLVTGKAIDKSIHRTDSIFERLQPDNRGEEIPRAPPKRKYQQHLDIGVNSNAILHS